MKNLGIVFCIAAAYLLSACSGVQPKYYAHDITGLMPRLEFSLHSATGSPVAAADLRGKTVLLYFGYTDCPDVCPTTLSDLAQALRKLGSAAQAFTVLFVSVDPQRDTPAVLSRFTAAFGSRVIGATGTDDQLTSLTKRYRVAYRRDTPDAEGNYAVYHSSAVFVFDAGGYPRLLVTPSETDAQLAADLQTLRRS